MKTELNRPADLKFVEQTVGIFSSRDNSFELQSVDLSGEEDKENDDENDEQEDPENEVEDILDGLNWFSRLQIQVLSPIEQKKTNKVPNSAEEQENHDLTEVVRSVFVAKLHQEFQRSKTALYKRFTLSKSTSMIPEDKS